jgi:hypothetical protein
MTTHVNLTEPQRAIGISPKLNVWGERAEPMIEEAASVAAGLPALSGDRHGRRHGRFGPSQD